MPDTDSAILPIYSVTPFTMLDFPERMACIVWCAGCNMRCGYCHNPEIVMGKGRHTTASVLAFLKRRQGLLDGVVLSGGEASVWPGLPDFMRQARALGYQIKLDTNGLRPDIMRSFLHENLLDYIALDYKAPPGKFRTVTGINKFKLFSETLDLLCAQAAVPFEVRTTVHTALMDEEDVAAIIADLDTRKYSGNYYVQNFRADNGRPTLGKLPEQPKILDCKKLPRASNFTIQLRNFD